jgi:hypothetical protein
MKRSLGECRKMAAVIVNKIKNLSYFDIKNLFV